MKCFLTFLMVLTATLSNTFARPTSVKKDPCAVSLTANFTTICYGGSSVLTANAPGGGCDFFGPITYTWSPAQDISATAGATVAVNPLATTTYTVVISGFNGLGNPTSATRSLTITVQTNCCQTTVIPSAKRVELTGSPYSTDPFSAQPIGTIFHAPGSLVLNAAQYTMKAGQVLLMEANTSVTVQNGGKLETNGATIMAACDAMWDGLYIAGTSDKLDMHSVPGGIAGQPLMHDRILHSKKGIVLQDSGPEFQLNYVEFLHNYKSLDIDRTHLVNHLGGPFTNKVLYCKFDSDPTLMKTPYKYNSATDYYYTDTHLRITGDLIGTNPIQYFFNNTFDHALIHVLSDVTTTPFRPYACTFSNFYLAGILYGNTTGTPLTAVTGSDALVVNAQLSGSTVAPTAFNFPSLQAGYPNTTQFSTGVSNWGYLLKYGTAGISAERGTSSPELPVKVNGYTFGGTTTAITFQQFTPPSYATSATQASGTLSATNPLQVGIDAVDITATLSNFYSLRTGIAQALLRNTTNTVIRQNYFGGCGYGYVVNNRGGSNNNTSPSFYGTVDLGCNTFNRTYGSAATATQYYGVFFDYGAYAKLGAGTTPTLTNRFVLTSPVTSTNFQAVYQPNSGLTLSVGYDTYTDIRTSLVSFANANVNLTANSGLSYAVNAGNVCAPSGPNGLPRMAGGGTAPASSNNKAQVEQSTPNPAQGSTTIAYQLPAGAQKAVLLMRRAWDGQVVATLPLDTKVQQQEVNLTAYPAGTYFYTLVVDGTPAATRRLVVQ